MSKLSVIARAVAMFNALHNDKFTEVKAESFLSCLDMVKSQEQEIPQIVAAEGEALLNAVMRAVTFGQAVDLIYDGKTIHIDPVMTMADAYAHAEYVLKLNERHPAGGDIEIPSDTVLVQVVGRGTRPVLAQGVLDAPADPTPALQTLMARAVEEPELTKQQEETMAQVMHAPQLGRGMRMNNWENQRNHITLDHAHSRTYTKLETGNIAFPERTETLEDVITRLMPMAPIRVRISGLVMTLQDGYTTSEMIEEAHRRLAFRINDEDSSDYKRLELAEEQLADGSIRTAARCWRRGYRYRLSVLPHNKAELAEYHIHLKERPTQGYMDPHLQLMYDKKAKVFLNITNGFNRFENITHFFCTARGRMAHAELAQIEKQIHEEYLANGGSDDDMPKLSPNVEKIAAQNERASGPFYSESWEDNNCGYRVKYWDKAESKWRYTYFPTQPNGMATQIRNVKGFPASIEFKKDFTTAPK